MRQLFVYLSLFVILYLIYRHTRYNENYNNFVIIKPSNWSSLPLYKKISYFNTVITKDYSPYVDKILAKSIVHNILGNRIKTAKIIRILDNPNDINIDDLNNNHMLKASHGSGWNIDINNNTNLIDIKKN